ncbi:MULTISPECIES: sodium:solute symporter [Sphingobacterium]|jgi:SSS family solute:Na+ symporter|uniref:sodium:solute symporter n=1 Tax=Sphingobacterium TaxID=28453 RepID=UPI0004E5F795|nr:MULTISPECIES: sodium:solute symporter [Sphingobacterium]CDS92656.1 Sodium-solute symporter [Sphingobacterium sp. PM2-P1-29]SJN32074.1 Sodium iodide symporter [Sphingobacterium faecium PCAi_F2.5]HCU43856.1 sodium:solute symporter [Sphingobacterium sp.]UXD69123.1 sodium:solute symporter [Sphingobacterium faecium]WGQ16853.1 sodium:solute symporter [Sphingobacterium faecium]
MSTIDWIVLILTLLLIVLYGMYKSRGIKNIDGYLLGNQSLPWYHVGLSVMATQASAITFLSAPGLAYSSGMSFVQFYFGLPLAMIVLCITFVPIFHKLRVYTAYEFLEKRFDIRTRGLTAFLFLIQRGISTGISIFAPALIIASILHINLPITTLLIGTVVVIYTTYGGTKAVSHTQLIQMSIIFGALLVAGILVVKLLPSDIGLYKALHIAGKSGKTNAIDFTFDLNNQYTVWTGIIGGFFLQLSYFGTDQSQVGRYLTGSSIKESRLGLLMNGLLKIPMQFCILLIGVLVFVYYQYHTPPIFFNQAEIDKLKQSEYNSSYQDLEKQQILLSNEKRTTIDRLTKAIDLDDQSTIDESRAALKHSNEQLNDIRTEVIGLIKKNNPSAETNDNNYIFLSFVNNTFPKGLIGLLIAVIFLASMGSTASAINSLASTSTVDIYKRFINKQSTTEQDLFWSRMFTLFWGIFSIAVALYASKLGNLLEAVNILGSLFYGTILGIFIVAFYMKKIGGKAVFYAAILSEVIIFIIWKMDVIAFLWLNVIGCLAVMILAYLMKKLDRKKSHSVE